MSQEKERFFLFLVTMVGRSLRILFQEVLIGTRQISSDWTKFQCTLCVIIFVIVHRNIITQTEDHQSACEDCFEVAPQIQAKIGAQQDFKHLMPGPFILSLKRTTEKIRNALKIIQLKFLTVSCRVVTKAHTYLNKPAAESCRFV